jgi:hypothetical protein
VLRPAAQAPQAEAEAGQPEGEQDHVTGRAAGAGQHRRLLQDDAEDLDRDGGDERLVVVADLTVGLR